MKIKKISAMCITTIVVIMFITFFLIYAFNQRAVLISEYNKANELIKTHNYDEAIEILETLQDYKDGAELLLMAQNEKEYYEAIDLLQNKEYEQAIDKFMKIKSFKDSDEKMNEAKYYLAVQYYINEDYNNAKKVFIELGDYSESRFYLAQIDIKLLENSQEIIYKKASEYYEERKYEEAMELYETIINYKDSKEKVENCKIQLKRRNTNNIIAAGIRNSAVIMENKKVKVIGNNDVGQCDTREWENIISIDIYGYLIIGLQEDGYASIAGKYNQNKTINAEGWDKIIDVAAGEQFVVGLKEDGTVIADGHNGDGQCNVEDWDNIINIDAGYRFTVALTEERELLFAGYYGNQAREFEEHKNEWQDVVNITAGGGGGENRVGGGHTVGLKSDGTLVAVGDNTYGQCDFSNTEKWSDIVKVAAGDWYTVGLKSDGTVVITGNNPLQEEYLHEEKLKSYNNIVDIAAGYGHVLCLTSEGTILSLGHNDDNKRDGIDNWENIMLP